MRRCLPCIVAVFFAISVTRAEMTVLDQPMAADVFLRSGSPPRLAGQLLRYDAHTLVIQTRNEQRALKWDELTPTSAFVLRSRLIDRDSAGDWLKLGEIGWSMGATDQARTALSRAVRMDPSLEPKVKEILASPSGEPAPAQRPRNIAAGSSEEEPPSARFEVPSPQRHEAAIARAQRLGQHVAKQFEIGFVELQTEHFIIFTDWDPREHNFLKVNVEGAYTALAKMFDVPVKENIFVGKLPIFMFARQNDFKKFAAEYAAGLGGELAGYYASHGDGTGHMAMWKPDVVRSGGDIQRAEREWAYTLTHEFAHAFIDRYLSNRRIPRWMNEGIAEVVAHAHFPRGAPANQARLIANRQADLLFLFDSETVPGFEYYPVMYTMVQMLLETDRRAFFEMFKAIKEGTDAQEALRKFYGLDYPQLIERWRVYARRLR